MRSKFIFYNYMISKTYHEEIVVQSAACVFAYFCGRQKK